MFTGIVTDVGTVRHIEKRGDTHVVIATHYDVRDIDIGASIACSGICLTVADKGANSDRWFAVTASNETVSKTTIAKWKDDVGQHLANAALVGARARRRALDLDADLDALLP